LAHTRRIGFPLTSGIRRQLGFVSDQPGRNGEQRTYRNSTHQDTHDRLYRSKQAPDWRKDNVPVPHGRITGRRKIEAGFPRSEASHAIKSCPQQDLQEVQDNRHAREPNHEHASMPEALCLDLTGKASSHPMDEHGHSCTLYGERQGAEDGGRKSLAEKFHRSLAVRSLQDEILPVTTTDEFTSIRRPRRLRVRSVPFHGRGFISPKCLQNSVDHWLISGTCTSSTSIAKPSRQSS